jgi:predicted transcriptional regulator of viral defense system
MRYKQLKLLDVLDEYGYDIFSADMLKDKLPAKEIAQAIRSLTNSGLLIRLERGKYRRKNFLDDFVIANFLAQDGGIAYWSALNFYGLTEQFPNIIFVQTALQKNYTAGYPKIKFVKVNKRKLIGYSEQGWGNHKYKITDIEKTIADCFDLPQHCGWFQETIKAFNNANLSAYKLIRYCIAINNLSAIKRLAFLTELLGKPKLEKFLDYAKSVIEEEYSLFETGGEKTGTYIKEWKLILNIPEEEILEIANS